MTDVFEDTTAPRKLTAEELQKSVERLTRSTRQPVQLKPVLEPKYISAADLQKSLKRLYDDSLERRARERAEVEREMQAATMKDALKTSTAPLSAATEEQMVRRLYEETIEQRKEKMAELERQAVARYRGPAADKAAEPVDGKEMVERLYRAGMEREREKHIALFEQYVIARRPPAPRRTAAQLAMSSDKMMRGESLDS